MRRIAITARSAKDYDVACQRLKDCDWPPGALVRAAPFLDRFPELTEIFSREDSDAPWPRHTLWEAVQTELYFCEGYRRLVRIRSRPYSETLRNRHIRREEVYHLCFPRVARVLLGKAAVWAVKLRPYRRKRPETTWLQWALNGARHEVSRAIREFLGLPIGGTHPAEDGASGHLFIKPETDLPESQGEEGRLTDREESRELPPDEMAETRERQQIVRGAILQLPEEDQKLLELKENYTFDEIDDIMDWPRGTAKKRMRRVFSALRRLLQGKFGPGTNQA